MNSYNITQLRFTSLLLIYLLASSCNNSVTIGGNANKDNIDDSKEIKINIDSPQQNAEVGLVAIVKGKVSDPDASVYVLIHPLSTGGWWIQPTPSGLNQDGYWQTRAYFGTDNQGIKAEYEIVAIAGRRSFFEGERLSELPSEMVRSQIITVSRIH